MMLHARLSRVGLSLAVSVIVLSAALPAATNGYATAEGPPRFSGVSGLPDGRVYEHVNPFNKYGNQAGAPYYLAGGNVTADGDGVSYLATGALTENTPSSTAIALPFVSQRSASGWSTRAVLAQPAKSTADSISTASWTLPSDDLSHFVFDFSAAEVGPPDEVGLGENIYLAGPDPYAEPIWIGRPQVEGAAFEANKELFGEAVPLGGTPDLSTVYFAWTGDSFPEDAARAKQPHSQRAWALYEYTGGALREAGVLPNGSTPAFGAVPAGSAGTVESINSPDQTGNQVSADGARVFFVSPEPFYSKYSTVCGVCSAEATELYVRETAADGTQKTVLISQSQLPGHVGEPAPHGPLAVINTTRGSRNVSELESGEDVTEGGAPSYVYASADGSHAFFQSRDQLTTAAPSNTAPKVYDFDLETGSLEYLPNVTGSIVASARDGSSFVFENTLTSPFELDRWTAGPNGGAVARIAQLPEPALICTPSGKKAYAVEEVPAATPICVGPARISADGSVVVFVSSAPIVGFNDGGHFEQIFRYDATSNRLSCVSCPPNGVAPTGDAVLSGIDYHLDVQFLTLGNYMAMPNRGVSPDDGRVFFETPAGLVPQDTNGKRDVYEWEDGTVFLLSSGTSRDDTFFIDNSQSGNDVFFATSAELTLGDNDATYDVYDARVPRPGDTPPPDALPCEGDVCQGPPSVPELLGAPSSATFSGVGNLTTTPTPSLTVKPKAKRKSAHKRKRRVAVHRKRAGKTRKSNRRGKR